MKKLGAITIDKKKKRFKVDGDYSSGGKDGALKKLVKGSAAVMTIGASVAAEKAVKGAKNIAKKSEWHDFSDYLSYSNVINLIRQYTRIHSAR